MMTAKIFQFLEIVDPPFLRFHGIIKKILYKVCALASSTHVPLSLNPPVHKNGMPSIPPLIFVYATGPISETGICL